MTIATALVCWQHGASPEAPASQRASGGCIGEPLAFETLHGERGALRIVDTKLRARIHPKVELGEVAIQVLPRMRSRSRAASRGLPIL